MNRNFSGLFFGMMLLGLALFLFRVPSVGAADEKLLQTIQERVRFIDTHLKDYRHVEKGIDGVSTEGTMLDGYFSNNIPQLIKSESLYESGREDDAFYFGAAGKLLYIYHKKTRYNQPLEAVVSTDTRLFTSEEHRYYFSDGRLVKQMIGSVEQRDDLTTSDTPELLKNAAIFSRALLAPSEEVDYDDFDKQN